MNQALRDTAFYRETQPGDVLRFARRILESRGGGSQGTGQGWYDRAQRNAVSDYGVRPFDRLLRELCQADGISLAAILGEKRLELQRERSLQIEELSWYLLVTPAQPAFRGLPGGGAQLMPNRLMDLERIAASCPDHYRDGKLSQLYRAVHAGLEWFSWLGGSLSRPGRRSADVSLSSKGYGDGDSTDM